MPDKKVWAANHVEYSEEICTIISDNSEKLIPKKPIEDETKCADGSTCDVVFLCPECKRIVCFKGYENHLEKEYPYCHCGQALDWGDNA